MAFQTRVFHTDSYADDVAGVIAEHLPTRGSVVLTGGTTAERVYPALARAGDWSQLEVLFSDERCVPPDDENSNFKMASELLLNHVGAGSVHRMRGEDPPALAARRYHEEIAPLVAGGLDLLLLGMGADAHVGAMFPRSPALDETALNCRAVDRPDGMQGLTLTPPALTTATTILLLVTGDNKAATVARVINGDEPIDECPARLLADHPNATFLLDEAAASAL
jgi:6-phosphogluconolactonase